MVSSESNVLLFGEYIFKLSTRTVEVKPLYGKELELFNHPILM